MKVSELCAMIQESIRSGRYPLETDTQKKFASLIEVANRLETDDLKAASVAVEVRVQALYSVNNYVPNIQHLPGVIEADVVDSFKMICRRIDRIDHGVQLSRN